MSLINFIEIEAGKYWEVLPSVALKQYIRKYYFTEGFVAYRNMDIHPIGKETIEMHFHYGKAGFDVFDFNVDDFVERRAYVVGNKPVNKLYKTRIIEKMAMLGVEFTNLGTIALLHCYPADLYEKILDVDVAFGSEFGELSKGVLGMPTNQERINALETFFKTSLLQSPTISDKDKAFFTYLDDHEVKTVEEMHIDLKVSIRTIERLFALRLGMCPKEYLRIARLNKACELLSQYPENNISDIINDCNFYDQSHFIHEFRQLMKKSPLQYLKQVNGVFYFGRGYVL